jgi:hypothetical protein
VSSYLTKRNANSERIFPWIKIRLDLLYRESIHGTTNQTFHERCDNNGPVMFLIKTEFQKVCGAYTSLKMRTPTAMNIGLVCTNKTSQPTEAEDEPEGVSEWHRECETRVHKGSRLLFGWKRQTMTNIG